MKVGLVTSASRTRWLMIYASRQEALSLIESLSSQLLNGDQNTGRAEHRAEFTDTNEHGYATVFVEDE